MRISIIVFLALISMTSLCAQTTTSWQMVSWGSTGATDIIEVENGYIAGISYGTQDVVDGVLTFYRMASLVKFDKSLSIVDSVSFSAIPDHNAFVYSVNLVGDSVYVLTFQTEVDASILSLQHWSIHSFDIDLNRGNRYDLNTDSSIIFTTATLYADSSFLFVGRERNNMPLDSVFVFKHVDLSGGMLSDTTLSFVMRPQIRSIWNVPNTNQVLINTSPNSLVYYDTENFRFDSIVVSPYNIFQIFTLFDGMHFGVDRRQNELTSYVAFDDDGNLLESFVIDTTFTLKNRSQIARPFANAMDYDTVSDAIYIANLHHYFIDGIGPSSSTDTLIVDLYVHKVNPVDRSIIWKKSIEIINATGMNARNASLVSIRATSDGGSVVVFQSAAYSMDGSVVYIIKLGPNGEVLSRNEIQLEDPILRLYPNPATSQLTIESDDFPVFISIADMNGKILFNAQSSKYNHTVDVEGWPNGVYLVHVRGENGFSTAKKVIVR